MMCLIKIKTLAVFCAVVLAGYVGYILYTKLDSVNPELNSPEDVTDELNTRLDPVNPFLNSPADITDELISDIIDNRINSLTINYEFTSCMDDNREDWEKYRLRSNPFWMANQQKALKNISFKVKLTSKVHSLACAFYDMKELEFLNLEDTSNVTNMEFMFASAKSFNQPIGNWDTSNVTNMRFMFSGAESFNQPIGNWNTSKVTRMDVMFYDAKSFNQPIGNWDTSNVMNMSYMFVRAESFNQPIGNWDTSKVVNMKGMFIGANAYSYPKPKGVE